MLDEFEAAEIQTGETTIFIRRSGSGSPILLLHGFPQTLLMWRDVAPVLARRFTVVCADLRGYGRSGCPASTADHAPYAKRAMARDMVAVMEQLGFPRFSIAGHDRGGRVAYRMALDHPDRVERLAVLDILPTATVWESVDARLALAYWPWSLLARISHTIFARLSKFANVSLDCSTDALPRCVRRREATGIFPAALAATNAGLRGPVGLVAPRRRVSCG
jgi:haloacetate dehalogenase